uniref:Uncharacterized protein n=1 Tax=Ciona savignyi TaxID=51511 RepID=H2YE80_CIOSA
MMQVQEEDKMKSEEQISSAEQDEDERRMEQLV